MILDLIIGLLAGVVVGVVYFGGLWLTVVHVQAMRHPLLLGLVSFLVRAAFALLAFYFIIGDSWQRLLAALVGFLIARILTVRRLRPVSPLEHIQT